MGVAALILGIVGCMVSLTIFKDASLICGVIAIVLAIITLVRKKKKVLPIIAIVLSVIGIILCFSLGNSSTEVTKKQGQASSSSTANEQKEEKVYGLNDEITIKNGDEEYTLVITGFKETQKRNQYSDKNPAQVFVIDYTYKCINSKDSLFVSDMDFKLIDAQGEIGDTYPGDIASYPKSITSGTTCKAQMVLCVNNKSDKVKLQFFDNPFNNKPDAVFEFTVAE